MSGKWILAALLAAGSLPAAIDPSREVVLSWPSGHEARHVQLLREAGVTVVLLPWPGAPSTAPFAQACRAAGITPVAELGSRSPSELSAQREAARAAGFAAIALEGAAFADQKALAAFLGELKGLEALVFLKPEQLEWRVAPALAVLREGQWPGVRRMPGRQRDVFEVASASREPWLDANSYLVAYLRALFPERATLLGYRPDEAAGVKADGLLPYHSLELALVEAMAAGGNLVLHPPERHHAELLAGNAEVLAAWRALGHAAAFLKRHAEWFRAPEGTSVAVAAGTLEQSGEILNMLYRWNASPAVVSAAAIPPLAPVRYRAAVVAGADLPPVGRQRVLDYVRAGGLVLAAPAAAGAPPWWPVKEVRKTRSQEDRDWYALGKGALVVYREPVLDPHEFALDVIDALGLGARDLRLWSASMVLGLLKRPACGGLAVVLINYGSQHPDEFLARVEGRYSKAVLYAPEAAEGRPLKVIPRTRGTEITVDRLGRLAVVVLD